MNLKVKNYWNSYIKYYNEKPTRNTMTTIILYYTSDHEDQDFLNRSLSGLAAIWFTTYRHSGSLVEFCLHVHYRGMHAWNEAIYVYTSTSCFPLMESESLFLSTSVWSAGSVLCFLNRTPYTIIMPSIIIIVHTNRVR